MGAALPVICLELGRGARERGVLSGAYAIAAGCLGGWAQGVWPFGLFDGMPALLMLVGAAVGWRVLQPLQGRLGWDGRAWWHESPERTCGVQLVWDVGPWVLLRVWRDDWRRPRWCGVSCRQAGTAWHGLRLAVFASGPIAAPGGASP